MMALGDGNEQETRFVTILANVLPQLTVWDVSWLKSAMLPNELMAKVMQDYP